MRPFAFLVCAAALLAACVPDEPPVQTAQPIAPRMHSAADWQTAARATGQEIKASFGDRMSSVVVRVPERGPAFDVGYADMLVTELVRAGYSARVLAPLERATLNDYEISFHSDTVNHPSRSGRREVLVTTTVAQRGYDVSRRTDVFTIAADDTPTYQFPRGRYVPVQSR